jgi:hypothetical protein
MFDVSVFIGKVLEPTNGGWITLPTKKEVIDEQITSFQFGDAEFEIMDVENSLPMKLGQYRDIYRLNEDLNIIRDFFEKGMERLLFTAYAFRDENLSYALQLLEKGNFEYYEDVVDEEELGRTVFESGRFGVNPDKVPAKVKQYMDYESIGLDWVSNGTVIYPQFKTAMMEVSA